MFTGLIQGLGTFESSTEGVSRIRCISGCPDLILQDLAIGDSVAVDGVCLTVVELLADGFRAAVSPETLSRSTLGQQQPENGRTYVNLETSLRVGSKLGGHFVTGHVDGIGCLVESALNGNSWEMRFSAPPSSMDLWQRQIAPYIVPKGSIAVNGISLTISRCDRLGSWFEVAVIPHTYEETNLQYLRSGSWVNLEGDILGKYVERFFQSRMGSGDIEGQTSDLASISPDFLAEHGYL
ncbi:MAG: riboflavin synthase [Cyanobacteriota bacterium]|nr:riboflavin synthase [Cyanobacteriota bacterium]